MNNKIVITASALVLGILGLSLSFLPTEIASQLGISTPPLSIILLQLLGAGYFGFAMLNWMMRHHVVGGIYNRPFCIANFAHYFIAGMALAKFGYKNPAILTWLWIITTVFIALAIAFGLIMNKSPKVETAR